MFIPIRIPNNNIKPSKTKCIINDNAKSNTGKIQPTTVAIPRRIANQTDRNSTTGTSDLITAFYPRKSCILSTCT